MKSLVVLLDLIRVGHAHQKLLGYRVVVGDQVGKLVGGHAHVEHKLLVVSECLLDMLNFLLRQRNSESFVQIKFELSKVEFLTHVDVPTGLRNYSRNKPVSIIEILLFNKVFSFRLWKWTKEVWGEEVRLVLIISQIIRLNFKIWEDIWLRHWKHHRVS